MRPHLFLCFALSAAAAASLAGCSDSAEPVEPASRSELASPGPFAVGEAEIVLVDPSRPTRANGSYSGAPERTLPTHLWFPATQAGVGGETVPADGGPFPLVGWAHGLTSNRRESFEIKRHLASHGYVVVAPEFPLSNGTAPGGPTIGDAANQPADLDFAMEAALRLPGDLAAVSATIDPGRRGIAGLSLGGGTALIAAFHPRLHLDAIQAAVALAPFSCAFGPALFENALPTMIVTGDADELVPIASGPARAFAFAPAPITLVRLMGGNHVGFLGVEIRGAPNSDSAACGLVESANPSGLRDLTADLSLGAGPDAVAPASCEPVCAESYVQTMSAARQIELTKIAILAHFEAVLRGRTDAARFVSKAFETEDPDVAVTVKD